MKKNIDDEFDRHFFITDIANRLPADLLPEKQTWSSLLSAVTRMKTERNNAIEDTKRIDWLADPEQFNGYIQLPTACVENNLHSLRAAIDEAMSL